MQLAVGAIKYTVQRMWELSCDGQRLDGLYDAHHRVIWLDGELPPDRWYEVLRHEYQHAWHHHVGRGKTDEADATLASLIDETFAEQLKNAGGIDALADIEISGSQSSVTRTTIRPAQAFIVSDNRTCGMCQTETAAGSIWSSAPIEIAAGAYVLDRWFRCAICDSVMVWRERCDSWGVPNGSVVTGEMLNGEPAKQWVASHQDQARPLVLSIA